LKIDV
jgi:hypothetical protein